MKKTKTIYVKGPVKVEVVRTLFGLKTIITDLTPPSPPVTKKDLMK